MALYPSKQQQFRTAGVEGVNGTSAHKRLFSAMQYLSAGGQLVSGHFGVFI